MVTLQNCLLIFVVSLPLLSGTYAAECNCHCRGFRGQHICENIENLWRVANTNAEKLLGWERYRSFVERFSERWKKEIADIVDMKIKEHIDTGTFLPKPENLISKIEDGMQNDASIVNKPPEGGNDIVSDLLVKVQIVENRTMEVEEELKSERRVRRDLEKEVKETQFSLHILEDQLQNVTVPVDAMMNQVQTEIYSSLEDMNKTIYEEHLKKLYYKVDGVVYKNETKQLDQRLEHIEIQLHEGDNSSIVSKLAEDIRTLEGNLYLLNNSIEDNVVSRIESIHNKIGDVLIPRIQTLETETVRKSTTEELEDRMAKLLNNTESFRADLMDVWSDIKDIRNFEEKFQNFSEQWSTSLKELQGQVDFLKNESLRQSQDDTKKEIFQRLLKDDLQDNDDFNYIEYTTWDPEVTPNVVHRFKISENDTMENGEDNSWDPITILNRLNTTYNETRDYEEYSNFEVTPKVVERTRIEDGETEFQEYTTLPSKVIPDVEYRDDWIDERSNEDMVLCEEADIEDANLLVDFVNDSQGRKHLKFGCRPIGLYAVSYLPMPPRCKDGIWKEPFPTCTILPTMNEIEALAKELQEKYRCSANPVELPDPTNCSQFFKCSHGKLSVMPCPNGLHFNSKLKVCDYPRTARCVIVKSSQDEKLQAFMPPIQIEPDNLDKPSSHLGTGSTGQLIVHPRSSFTLHCLYPDNVWGYPKWSIAYSHSGTNTRNLESEEGSNRISLTVTAATEEDSGIYRCVTPFGVQHAIEVIVKVVVCPSFTLEEEYEEVFYRPTPEGELRIMGTRAEFECEEGHKVYAQCMASGNWSRGLPSDAECTLKKKKRRCHMEMQTS